MLSLPGGLRGTEEVDPVALALVSGADGTVSMRDQLTVLASAFDTPEAGLVAMAVPVVAHLVERGSSSRAPRPKLATVRAVVQTVSRASVSVDGEVVGAIGAGLLVLVGVTHSDSSAVAETMARKVHELRILDDDQSAATAGSEILVVSQFTLYADTRKGRRPGWSAAAPAEVAEPLVTAFVDALRRRGAKVETGRFRAMMLVESVNVGPRTVILSSEAPSQILD